MEKKTLKAKKLSLNRETLRSLNNQELAEANGGTILSLALCTVLLCTVGCGLSVLGGC